MTGGGPGEGPCPTRTLLWPPSHGTNNPPFPHQPTPAGGPTRHSQKVSEPPGVDPLAFSAMRGCGDAHGLASGRPHPALRWRPVSRTACSARSARDGKQLTTRKRWCLEPRDLRRFVSCTVQLVPGAPKCSSSGTPGKSMTARTLSQPGPLPNASAAPCEHSADADYAPIL